MTGKVQGPAEPTAPRRRLAGLRFLLIAIASLLFAGFFALGTWQVQRLQWKLALIERVQQRVHAAPVEAPAAAEWAQVGVERDEYRHVQLSGVFLHALTARVQASTTLGSGYWLLAPLCRNDGSIVLVNRGFIADASLGGGRETAAAVPVAAAGACEQARQQGATVTVAGLLRISEPGGGFLRHNDAAGDRWYSRDVPAIAAARRLSPVAPYFVDADETPGAPTDAPIGGLTVVSFHNNHLVYALTWYALALMVAGAGYWVVRYERAQRRDRDAA